MAVRANENYGYQEQEFSRIFGGSKGFLLKGAGPEAVREYDDTTHKYTPKVLNQKVEIYYAGLGTQVVKLPANFKFPKGMPDLAEIILVRPEACQIRRKVYVRAESLQLKAAPRRETNE